MLTLRLVLLLSLCGFGVGLKILAFIPLPGKSHHIAFRPMLYELAKRGHQVDYYTPFVPTDAPPNLRVVKVLNAVEEMKEKIGFKQLMKQSVWGKAVVIGLLTTSMGDKFLKDPEIAKLLKSNEKYDLVMMELHFGQEFLSTLMHKFNALGISLLPSPDAAWVNELSGLIHNPSYMLDFKSEFTEKMTFFERVQNTYITLVTLLVNYYFVQFPMQSLADEYIRYDGWETRPSILKMTSDVALTLINSHHSFGYSSPKAPNVKEVGGMNLSPVKPLPKDLQVFMDSADKGVIYFSYGSNVDMREMMTDDKFDAFLHTFKKLPLKVLWKWTDKQFPKVDTPNVFFSDWFPQQDVLAHKNIKLFITHGGMMSTIEAISNGVPLIGTAVFGDQPKNLKFVEYAGIGISLEYDNITRTSASWAVNEIISNPSYKKNVVKRSKIFKDRPISAVDEAVYWVEYVGKYGKVLQSAAVHMPFYQVYMLDVIGVVLGSLLVICYVLRRILKALCSLCQKRTIDVLQKKKKQ